MIIEEHDWKEYHPNGNIWISGKIGIVAEMWKHLYDVRFGFMGFENLPVCRLGEWTKHFDNGQLAWTLDYDNYGYFINKNRSSFRNDGTIINT